MVGNDSEQLGKLTTGGIWFVVERGRISKGFVHIQLKKKHYLDRVCEIWPEAKDSLEGRGDWI